MRSELSVEDVKWALLIVGIGLILWGIHDFNYAKFYPHSWFCPSYGFLDQGKDAESYAVSRNSGR